MTHIFELEKDDYSLALKNNYLVIKETSKPLKVTDSIVLQCGHEETIKILSFVSNKETIGIKPNYRIINFEDKKQS